MPLDLILLGLTMLSMSCGMASCCIGTDFILNGLSQNPVRLRNPKLLVSHMDTSLPVLKSALMKLYRRSIVRLAYISNAQPQHYYPASVIGCVDSVETLTAILSVIDVKNLGIQHPVLVVIRDKDLLERMQSIRIDQEIYFLYQSQTDYMLYEVYTIGNRKSVTLLGTYSIDLNRELIFKPDIGAMTEQTLVRRRSNFFGQNLIAMVEHEPPDIYLPSDIENHAQFHENNQTFDVTNVVKQGRYLSLFQDMANELNFTFKLYKRKDGVWGSVANGKPVGMLEDLTTGSADLVAGGYALVLVRIPYIKPLVPVSESISGLFIKRDMSQENFDWTIFLEPLQPEVWIVILCSALTYGIVFHFTNESFKTGSAVYKVSKLFGWIWMSFSTNLGGRAKDPMKKHAQVNKIALFSCLVSGTIIWIAFRSQIIAILSVVKISFPVDSLESLLGSSFTLATYVRGSGPAVLFEKAAEGTLNYKLLKGHMQSEESFLDVKEGLTMVVERVNFAYFFDRVLVRAIPGFECSVVKVYDSTSPMYSISFATRLGSPYYQFLNWKLLQLKENGVLNWVNSQFVNGEANCDPLNKSASPLTMQKLASIFVALLLGFVLALAVLILEIKIPDILPRSKPAIELDPDLKRALVGLESYLNGNKLQRHQKQMYLDMSLAHFCTLSQKH